MISKFTDFNESLFQKDTTGQNYDKKGENLIVQQDEDLPFYDKMQALLDRANVIYCKFRGDDPSDWTITTANVAKDCLLELDTDHELYDEAQDLYDEIENLEDERDEADEEEMLDREEAREEDEEDEEDEDINESRDVNDENVDKEDQEELFKVLASLGFSRKKTDFNKTVFKNDDEIFIFPQHLQKRHFYATRKQLVENGWILEKDFNKKFKDIVDADDDNGEEGITEMENLLDQADIIYSEYSNQVPGQYGFETAEEAIEYLSEIDKDDAQYKDAQILITKIETLDEEEEEEDENDIVELINLLKKASALYSKYSGYNNKNHVDGEYIFTDPDEAMEYLLEIDEESKYYEEAQDLIDEIDELVDEDIDDEEPEEDEKDEDEDDDYSEYEMTLDANFKAYLERQYPDSYKEKYQDYLKKKYSHLKKEKKEQTKREEKIDKNATYYTATAHFKNSPKKEFEVLIKCGETDDNEDVFYYVEDEKDLDSLMDEKNDENFVIEDYYKTDLTKSWVNRGKQSKLNL